MKAILLGLSCACFLLMLYSWAYLPTSFLSGLITAAFGGVGAYCFAKQI